jgi:hypothetical protein
MPGLGENDLLIDSRIVGKFRVESIHAVPAIYPRLGISLRCQLLDAKTDEYSTRAPLVGFELQDLAGELLSAGNLWCGPQVGGSLLSCLPR